MKLDHLLLRPESNYYPHTCLRDPEVLCKELNDRSICSSVYGRFCHMYDEVYGIELLDVRFLRSCFGSDEEFHGRREGGVGRNFVRSTCCSISGIR